MSSDRKYYASRQSSSDTSSDSSETSKESLIEYINSLSNDEINSIVESPVSSAKLGEFFRKFSVILEQQHSTDSLETIKEDFDSLLPKLESIYFTKYNELTELIKKVILQGEKVVKILQKNSNYLDNTINIGTLLRLTGSAVDTISTFCGLMLKRAQSSLTHYAFQSASLFGVVGLLSTVGEVAFSKSLLSEVMNVLEDYQELLTEINTWFQKTETFDQHLRKFLPYGIDVTVVKEIQEDSSNLNNYSKIFKAGFLSNVRKNKELIKDEEFYWKLDFFSKTETAVHWWNWVIFREHPIVLDFVRMKLQMNCDPNGSILFQSIPALPLEQQRLLSLPVGGRILLNFLTIYDAINDLRCGSKYRSSEKMRRLLNDIVPQLERLREMNKLMTSPSDSVDTDL